MVASSSQQFSFGVGQMFGTRSDIANATPVQFGTLQDVSLDFSFTDKPLMGQYQLPVANARGAAKLTGKAKFARLDPAVYSDIFFGQSRTTGASDLIANGEAGMVPASSVYTLTSANAATWVEDLGVTYAATGLSFTKVVSGPAAGQYSVSAGIYTFAAADASAAVLLSYLYTSSTTGNKLVITNQLMGQAPTFKLRLFNTYQGRATVYEFNQAQSSKLTLNSRNEDWLIPELDFSLFTDASNTLGTISFSQ